MLKDAQTAVAFAGPGINANKRASFFRVAISTAIKDLRIARRYLPNLIGDFVQIIIRVLFFLLLSNFAVFGGKVELKGREMFIFFLGAILLWVFNGTALSTPLNSVTSDLYNGTLEYLYSNPISRYAYYVGTVFASATINLVLFVPAFIFLIFYSGANPSDTLRVLLASMLTLVALIALGIMIALLGLLWRQAGSIVGVLFLLFEFLAGAYFPVGQYPKIIQYLAYILPHTWGFDLVRHYSLKSSWTTIGPVWMEWTIIGGFAVIYTFVSYFLLGKVEKQSKKRGLHLI